METVLLVDDTKSYRDKMGGVLRENGLEVVDVATTGITKDKIKHLL